MKKSKNENAILTIAVILFFVGLILIFGGVGYMERAEVLNANVVSHGIGVSLVGCASLLGCAITANNYNF